MGGASAVTSAPGATSAAESAAAAARSVPAAASAATAEAAAAAEAATAMAGSRIDAWHFLLGRDLVEDAARRLGLEVRLQEIGDDRDPVVLRQDSFDHRVVLGVVVRRELP